MVAFLHHLEQERNNSIKTRHVRLTAIRGLCADIARREPGLGVDVPESIGHSRETYQETDGGRPCAGRIFSSAGRS